MSQDITDYEDFTGRTEAIATVEVRAGVTGYLEKVHFKEGMEVRQDDLLFEIDPRPYQAELAKAEANVRQTEVRFNRLNADYERASSLGGRGTASAQRSSTRSPATTRRPRPPSVPPRPTATSPS